MLPDSPLHEPCRPAELRLTYYLSLLCIHRAIQYISPWVLFLASSLQLQSLINVDVVLLYSR